MLLHEAFMGFFIFQLGENLIFLVVLEFEVCFNHFNVNQFVPDGQRVRKREKNRETERSKNMF